MEIATIYGIGINDAGYKVQPVVSGKKTMCPYYKTWKDMMRRCYGLNPTGATVSRAWRRFSTFKQWMKNQDWCEKHLDKDVTVPGNKEYSPDKCAFISPAINTMMAERKAKATSLPTGVTKKDGRYRTQIYLYNKPIHLGYFDTVREALVAYTRRKIRYFLMFANEQDDRKIAVGLIRHAKIFHNRIS